MDENDPGFFDLSRFTAEELRIARERMRPAREEANRQDAGLWALQSAEAALDEKGLLNLDAGDKLVLRPEGDNFVAEVRRSGSAFREEIRPDFDSTSEARSAVNVLRARVNDVAGGGAAWTIGLGSSELNLLASVLSTITTSLAVASVQDSGVPFTAASQSETREVGQENYALTVTWAPEFVVVSWVCQHDSVPPDLVLILELETESPMAIAAVEPAPEGSTSFSREALSFDPTERPWKIALLCLR